ncbi:FAD-binding oxidoreductase [Streptodolium elevatio]|uniref:FAD-binding oxidoreductase n=1 Tax=Streptodolium elevatio TaxID=3157996 RepID=A0ABV3DAJ5_9ACTN
MPTDAPAATGAGSVLPEIPEFAAPGRVAPSLRGKVDWQDGEIVELRAETPRMLTVRLALPVWNAHVAGQHYMVRLTAADGYTAQRHYSVASAPGDTGHIELTVDRVDGGEVSGYFHGAARVGDRIEVRGPLGGFFAWAGDRPALLIGGGSGLVPLVAMLRHHRAAVPGSAAADVGVELLACVRTPEDLPYREELTGDQVTVVHSRVAPPGLPVGRLTPEMVAPYAARAVAEDREVYVCGSTGFAEAVGRMLTRAGVPPARIRLERFGDAVPTDR